MTFSFLVNYDSQSNYKLNLSLVFVHLGGFSDF